MKTSETLKMGLIAWVWNHTPTCAEMARLASLSLDQPSSLKVRVQMRLHYLICVWCKRYREHLAFLHRAAPEFSEQYSAVSDGKLSAEAKQRMIRHLRAAGDR